MIYGCSQPRELWFIDFNHVQVMYVTRTNLALAYSASLWANVLCSLEVQLGSTDDAPVATPPSGRLRIFTWSKYYDQLM